MGDKNSKNGKKESKKFEIALGLRDPAIARVVRVFLIVLTALAFATSIVIVYFTANAAANGGFYGAGDTLTVPLSDANGHLLENGARIRVTDSFGRGDTVGFVFTGDDGRPRVTLRVVSSVVELGGVLFKDDYSVAGSVLGVYEGEETNAFVLAVIGDPALMIILSVVFVVLSVLAALVYFLVSPRGAKKFEKKDETGESAAPLPVAYSADNASLIMKYISTDDNIQPLDRDENILPGSGNTNYYGSVRLHEGEVYTVVKKYTEAVPELEEYGASDMDVIKMNMVGNAEFENLILNPHKEKTLSMQEVIDYLFGLDGVHCIKRRGTLNWVFKYKSKTIAIVKENDDHSGFKVSVKVYPDAAYKLNIIYKSLEDSTFPIGPFWYMFNNLRNLPGNVIRWLLAESHKISKWQQVRADLLRETPSLDHYGYDVLALRATVLSGTKVKDFDRFTIITQTLTPENRYATVLETGFEGLDTDAFTKEFTMIVPHAENMSFSMLAKRNASEAFITSFCDEMADMCAKEVVKADPAESAEGAGRIVRRAATVRKKKK